jgi:hypothetical protein
MSDKPKVVCEKPKLPTLWLDTSVVIKLTKVERGEKLQQVEVDRLTRLRTLVQELVPSGKLIFHSRIRKKSTSLSGLIPRFIVISSVFLSASA